MDAEAYHLAIDVKTVKGNSIPKDRSVDAGEFEKGLSIVFWVGMRGDAAESAMPST